jgi:single-strand DNA-binding protein
MRGLNRVMLIGNLGKDPDVQYLEGNISMAKFPLATTEMFKERSGKMATQTEWHNIILWRGLADLAQKFLHKGSLIYLEGRLRTRSWEDREGHKKFVTEIMADNFIMLDRRTDAHGSNSSLSGTTNVSGETENDLTEEGPPPHDEATGGLPF